MVKEDILIDNKNEMIKVLENEIVKLKSNNIVLYNLIIYKEPHCAVGNETELIIKIRMEDL